MRIIGFKGQKFGIPAVVKQIEYDPLESDNEWDDEWDNEWDNESDNEWDNESDN